MEVADRQSILSPGDMLGCYRIENFLGQGGFGVTYIAHDTMLDMQVAIKEYLPERLVERVSDTTVQVRNEGDKAIFERGIASFLKEARTLARFKHPNIVRVMSVFELNGTAYMVMEYERGHDLKQLFHHHKCVSENELKAIVEPVMDGLEEVHRHGFIHRDIKPANILVREDGSPVLLDFGSARLAVGHNTDTMTAMVTVGFAPLEQYSGLDDQQGPWTDIYALGAVLYFAVTGEAPLDSTLRGAAVLNDKSDPLVPLTRLAPEGYSPAFCRAVDWALQFKVTSRPQSLAQWRSRLCDSEATQGALSEPIARLLQTGADTLSLSPNEQNASGDDALTVIREPTWQRTNQAALDDGFNSAERDIETADTVLIEPNWDITDISQNQNAVTGRRKRYRKHSRKSLPILLGIGVLALASGLVLYKPWESSNSIASSTTSAMPLATDQALRDASVQDLEQPSAQSTAPSTAQSTAPSTAPSTEQTVEQSTEQSVEQSIVQNITLGAEQVTANAAADSANGSTQQSSIPTDVKLDDASGNQAQESAQEGQVVTLTNLESPQVDRDSRLEADRAVQREEARRQAQLLELQEAELAEKAQEDAARLALEREAEEARKAARARSTAAAAAQNAIRPVITDADISTVLRQFNALSGAVRALDGEAVREITVPDDRKNAYFDYVFRTFDTVEVSVSNISASRRDQTVRGTLTVKRLIRSNGDIAIPPEEFKNISIYSVKERQWSAIHW